MGRAKPFLTLNLPERGLASGVPVVASYNPRLLRLFKAIVLQEWEDRARAAGDEVLAAVDRIALDKLRATLDLLIPDCEKSDAQT